MEIDELAYKSMEFKKICVLYLFLNQNRQTVDHRRIQCKTN